MAAFAPFLRDKEFLPTGSDQYFPCLRVPFLFEIDLSTCRNYHDSDARCFYLDRVNMRAVNQTGSVCSQCALNLMHLSCADTQSKHSGPARVIGPASIGAFAGVMSSILCPNPNRLYYYLQSPEHMAKYLLTIEQVMIYATSQGDAKMFTRYAVSMEDFISLVSEKRRWVRSFVEAAGGYFFKRLVVDEFKLMLQLGYQNSIDEEREGFNIMRLIFAHLHRHDVYRYLRRAQRKKRRARHANYEWVVHVFLEQRHPRDSICNGMQEIRRRFKKRVKNYRVCDNRLCERSQRAEPLRRCRRCRMMWYCSRRCQKKDWSLYGHRALCFEYPLSRKRFS